MKNKFEAQLSGGHHNSLGNKEEVVSEVLADPTKFNDLFVCYFSSDELVRLRVSSAVKRITKAEKQIVIPYIDRLISEISKIDQASTQWTLANLFSILEQDLSENQKNKATDILKNNLQNHTDWIVLNTTMECLFEWSKKEEHLRQWLLPELTRLKNDHRKSVAKRATKYLNVLSTKKPNQAG